MFKIGDSHNDFLVTIKNKDERKEYIKQCSLSPLKLLCCAMFTTDDNLSINDTIALKNELQGFKKDINLLFAIEDMGFIKNYDELETLISLKPISCTLTWNYQNQLSGGTYDNNGLTRLGREYINKLEDNNIFVDTAHLNKKAFWQVCKISKKPIYNSHSNLYSFKKHKRNLTDKQIKKIVDSDGYFGLTLYNKFISKEKTTTSKDIALQIDYLIKNFGYKNFGFGTDFYGIDKQDLPTDMADYNDLEKIASHLKSMGYTDKVIEQVFYKNYFDFLKRNNLI